MRLTPSALVATTVPLLALLNCATVAAEPRRDPPIVSASDAAVVFLDGKWSATGWTRDSNGGHACTH
jgi:hypothetical protein